MLRVVRPVANCSCSFVKFQKKHILFALDNNIGLHHESFIHQHSNMIMFVSFITSYVVFRSFSSLSTFVSIDKPLHTLFLPAINILLRCIFLTSRSLNLHLQTVQMIITIIPMTAMEIMNIITLLLSVP